MTNNDLKEAIRDLKAEMSKRFDKLDGRMSKAELKVATISAVVAILITLASKAL